MSIARRRLPATIRNDCSESRGARFIPADCTMWGLPAQIRSIFTINLTQRRPPSFLPATHPPLNKTYL